MSKWTAERLREFSQQLRSFRNEYGEHVNRETDDGKAALGKLGDVIRMVDDIRAVKIRESSMALMRSQPFPRGGPMRRRP